MTAPLPPSWNAYRHALAGLGLALDAADCYGFAGGPGFLYRPGPAPLLLGLGALAPMEELVITVGGWIDAKHSTDRAEALAEMSEHLARERTSIIVPLRPEPGDDLEPAADAQPATTFAAVREITDERVVLLRGPAPERVEAPLAAWLERMPERAPRWSVVISNGRFTDVHLRLRSSLGRAAHRLRAGWRGRMGGTAALSAFLAVLRGGDLPLGETLRASAQLGGGMGRGLFARFLERHERLLPGAAPACALFRELDSMWRAVEVSWRERSPVPAAILRQIEDGEAASVDVLEQLAGAWALDRAARATC